MTVDAMRTIDYFIGVPLCFVVTLIHRLINMMTRPASSLVRNVLLIELSEMGSTVLADPAMRKLRQRRDAALFFVIFAKNRPSLDLLGTVSSENIFTIRDTGFFSLAGDTLRFLAWTRRKKIDTVVDLELFSRFSALLSGLSGAGTRVGFHRFSNEGLYRGDLLTHRVAYNPHQHIAKNFIALVNALLARSPEVPYSKTIIADDEIVIRRVQVNDADKDAMMSRVKSACAGFETGAHRLVLFNANASELLPQRCWPAEYYAALAKNILQCYQDVHILFTGSAQERTGIENIVRTVGHARCVNFAGKTSLTELPALYSIASFMLSNDSGPAHFAAVTPLPTYVLFGPETPRLYGPLGNSTPISAGMACSPCVSAFNHRKTLCTDNVCLQAITPQHVLELLTPCLEK